MPSFKSFTPWFPQKGTFDRVSSRSADFHHLDDVKNEMERNPDTFLHMTKAHLVAGRNNAIKHSQTFIEGMLERNNLVSTPSPCYLMYKQIHKGRSYIGWMGLSDSSDYKAGTIKKHEETKKENERFLLELFEACKILVEPVLLAISPNETLAQLAASYQSKPPYDQFTSPDGKKHFFWTVDDANDMKLVEEQMNQEDAFYIADGHHRCSTASQFAEKQPHVSGFLSCIMSYDQFKIDSFYRIYECDTSNNLAQWEEISDIYQVSSHEVNNHHIFLIHKYKYYKIVPKDLNGLSLVEWLENNIIKKILEIEDSGTDERAHFYDKGKNLDALIKQHNDHEELYVFTVPACNFTDIIHTADDNRIMPPKSTYIEPKLRAGMVNQLFK